MRTRSVREYAAGSLWVWPTFWALIALIVGFALAQVKLGSGSLLAPLSFQGTADDARTLLITIASTVVTVIALVLGLTVVALQLSSTQFSPRLLRNFLRDRATQRVLSVFLATFTYSAAGLYTVGVNAGSRVEDFPRLSITGAIVLLFVTLGMVVYFADHLAHSIQIDAIIAAVQGNTLAAVRTKPGTVEEPLPDVPAWAVPVPALRSGYLRTARPQALLPLARQHHVQVQLTRMVGQHVVAGTTLAWVWRRTETDEAPAAAVFEHPVDQMLTIGFERTLEQDAAFGVRQLVDMACKALSPAVNDPYTGVQAVDHLTVIFCVLARRALGDDIATDPASGASVSVPGRRFGDYLSTMCGLIRRYGCTEPTVMVALLRLLDDCAAVVGADALRRATIAEEARLIRADAERAIAQPADLVPVASAADGVLRRVGARG